MCIIVLNNFTKKKAIDQFFFHFRIGGIFLGLTSGYYSSLAMMYCPRTVEPEYAATAGMFGAACLITGIFCGINFSLVMPIIVESIQFASP